MRSIAKGGGEPHAGGRNKNNDSLGQHAAVVFFRSPFAWDTCYDWKLYVSHGRTYNITVSYMDRCLPNGSVKATMAYMDAPFCLESNNIIIFPLEEK